MEYPLIANRYQLLEKLGRGAAGEVWLCHDNKLARQIALKILVEGKEAKSKLRLRLQREVETCARVRHPNVVHLLDFGEDSHFGLFYTMEFLAGETLLKLLEEKGRLSEKDTQTLLTDLAHGLAAIHKEDIVHRDLSSGNILLTEKGAVICDFGLVLDEQGTQLTQTGTIMGTPAYIAPEILEGEEATILSDIYQWGVIGYEALTGSPPYDGRSIDAVFMATLQGKLKEPSAQVEALDPNWDLILCSALQRKPEERPSCANDLLASLDSLETQKTKRITKYSQKNVPPPPKKKPWLFIVFLVLFSLFVLMHKAPPKTSLPMKKPTFTLLSARAENNFLHFAYPNETVGDMRVYARSKGKDVIFPHQVLFGPSQQSLVLKDFPKDKELVIVYGDSSYKMGPLLTKQASEIGARLLRHAPKDLLRSKKASHRVERELLWMMAEDEGTKKELVKRDLEKRRVATKKLIAKSLSSKFIEAYRRGAAISSLVQSWPTVAPKTKQLFYEAMDLGRRVELLAVIEQGSLTLAQREAVDLREPQFFGHKQYEKELELFSRESPLALGQSLKYKKDSLPREAAFSFLLPEKDTTRDFALLFHTHSFSRLTCAIYLNEVFAGRLLCKPWIKAPGEKGRRELNVSLPAYLFKEGKNELVLRVEDISKYRLSSRIELFKLLLRW